MTVLIIGCILLVALFLQSSILSWPLVLGILIAAFAVFHKSWIIFAAFFIGVLVDVLSFQHIGYSSLFFVGIIGILFLYSRKFEVTSWPFVLLSSFFASTGSFLLFYSQISLFTILFTVAVTLLLFPFFLFIQNHFSKNQPQ